MRSVFIDSDILLDLILKRYPFYEWALGLFFLIDEKEYSGCTSVHSLLNVHYIAKKSVGEKSARASIRLLSNKINIISEGLSIIEKALDSNIVNFEDAVQHCAAVSANANFIITRNTKDYKKSTIPVLTAEQFLRTL
ncbi:PIN domain-containing protein [uncultured Mucilaginibacter sp.]|uniref:type II toxin-antitoxin system VapC family toxin n=1 Tax=uncultured Mucilaginibacter sp. TaxID=797541 RepID=UPI0025DA7EB7|nr:PIN domain-containing protein [uncultured Mucilaginibacter sp.]